MTIALKRKKTKGRLPILNLLFPKLIRETKCPTCGLPFLEHPDREPTHRYTNNDVELLMYAKHSDSGKDYRARVGVWKPSQDSFTLCQLFNEKELTALLDVVAKAVEFIKVEKEVNEKKGTAQKMSSSQSSNNT
jgi:hypothetical protein